MRLFCDFAASVGRGKLDDYVRHLDISVLAGDEDDVQEFVLGKLALVQILWAEADADRIPLFDVCYNQGTELSDLQMILAGGNNHFRPALGIDQWMRDVLFLRAAVFHPTIRRSRLAILEKAFRLFGDSSLAAMWKETAELGERDLAKLGFCKIAGEELIYRPSAKAPAVKRKNDGLDADVHAMAEYEDWVLQEWQRSLYLVA